MENDFQSRGNQVGAQDIRFQSVEASLSIVLMSIPCSRIDVEEVLNNMGPPPEPVVDSPLDPSLHEKTKIEVTIRDRRIEFKGNSAREFIIITRGTSNFPDTMHRVINVVDTNQWVLYAIACSTSPSLYIEMNKLYFEPMIQSFKFEEHKGG